MLDSSIYLRLPNNAMEKAYVITHDKGSTHLRERQQRSLRRLRRGKEQKKHFEQSHEQTERTQTFRGGSVVHWGTFQCEHERAGDTAKGRQADQWGTGIE